MPPGRFTFRNGPKRRHERATMLVDRDGVQADIDMVSEIGVVKSQKRKRQVAGERRQPEPGRNAVRAHRVPNGDADDPPILVKRLLSLERAVIGDAFPVARSGVGVPASHRWAYAIVLPRGLHDLLVGTARDARRADQSGERAHRVRSSRKTDEVDLVLAFIVLAEPGIGVLNDGFEAKADGAAQQLAKKRTLCSDAIMIETTLSGLVARDRLDQRPRRAIRRIELRDIRVEADTFVVPRAVDEDDVSLHAEAPLS